MIETYRAIRIGKLENLSEQEIIDCSLKNYGCQGGEIEEVFKYVMEQGVTFYKNYNYTGLVFIY